MKRISFIIVNLLITIVLLGMLVTTVKAESGSSFKANVTPGQTTVKPGGEVTVTVNVSDINMGANGINTLEGKISYDSTIFEEIKSSNIQSQNNWTTTYNDQGSTLNGKFLSVNLSSGIKENTNIFSIKFKVKADIKETKETSINFENITSNNGTDLINVGTKSVKVIVEVDKQATGETTKPENKVENKEPEQTTNTKKENTVILDKTQSKTIIPKTGIGRTAIIVLVIGIIVVIGLGIKNRTMKDIK